MASRDDEEKEDGAIRVTDRRRFTETGEERTESSGEGQGADAGVTSPTAEDGAAAPKATAAGQGDAVGPTPSGPNGPDGPTAPDAASAAAATEATDGIPFDLERLGIEAVFVVFWQSAVLRLGAVDPSSGESLPVDLDEARQSIELLRLLEEKTRGNLTEDESQTLGRLIHDAQVRYVAVARREKGEG